MRVNVVKKARMDQGMCSCGHRIEKGESYKWIKFRFGVRRFKCANCSFRASELTQSDFLGQVYDLNDRLGALCCEMSPEDLAEEIENIASEFNSLGDEQEEKKSNMPEQLQDGDVGQMLESRADSCRDVASNLEGVDCSFDEGEAKEEARGELEGDGVHTKDVTEAIRDMLREQARAEVNEAIEGKPEAALVLDKIPETEDEKINEIADRLQELIDEWIEEGLDEVQFEKALEEKVSEKRNEKSQEIVDEATGYSYEGE